MSDDALYVYGVVKSEFDSEWKETGIEGKNVYVFNGKKFSALVHDCKEEPYNSKDFEKIKELIIIHNRILDRGIEGFGGVIPLRFNTIIKKGENSSAQDNLKKWFSEEQERLEKIWNKVKGKREYGIRIYYKRDKLVQEASESEEIKEIEKNQQGKGRGMSYLLKGKEKDKTKEIVQNKINRLKQEFYDDAKKFADDIKTQRSLIGLEEEKELLLNLSILTHGQQISKIKEDLEKRMGQNFSFQMAGPFAPYSFAEV